MPVDPYLADVSIFAGNFAPRGWAFCDGQLLPIAQYSALFSLLGTTYGGDGRTTFALPDLRGRVVVGPGNGPGLGNKQLGERGGNETTTLLEQNLPSHNHGVTLHAESQPGVSGDPTGRMLGVITGDTKIYADVDPSADVPMASQSITQRNVGANIAFSNEQPYLAMHYIIALQGVFPSRS